MRFDRNGVLLADVVGSGVTKKAADQKSGNPNHDTHSGKFGGGGGGGNRKAAPPNVDPVAFARYRDAVREAARKFPGKLSPENLQAFIKSRAANPAAVNIQQFAQLVGQQQLDDIVDALDTNHGGFKVTAPTGYVSKILAGLSDDDVSEIVTRLKARGVKDPHIKFGRALPGERKEAVRQIDAQKQDVQASDEWQQPDEVISMDWPKALDPVELAEAITASMAKIPAPIINIEPPVVHVQPPEVIVNVPPAPRTRKVVERDEMGLITSVSEAIE